MKIFILQINGVIFYWVLRAMMTSHRMIMRSLKEKIRYAIPLILPNLFILSVLSANGLEKNRGETKVHHLSMSC